MSAEHAADRQAVALIVGSATVLLVIAGLVGWQSIHAPELDPITHCERNRPVAGDVVVLLDLTDRLDRHQERRLREWFEELAPSLKRNERVELWTLGGGGLERVFCSCHPGYETDPIFHNPAMSHLHVESVFIRPLQVAVAAAINGTPSPHSPILEAIRTVSEQSGLAEPSRHRSLVLVSDLVEHTGALNFYHAVPRFDSFRRSALFSRVRAGLHDVTISILYLPRGADAATLSPRLAEFWADYFRACGAGSVRIRRL